MKNPMQDTDQMLVNDARSIGRAIAARKRKIDALEKRLLSRQARKYAERPRRYSMEFTFDPDLSGQYEIQQRVPTQHQSFTVDGGTEFYCLEVANSLRVVGPAEVGFFPSVAGQFASVTMPYDLESNFGSAAASPNSRDNYLEFFYQIRDTDSDRAWQDVEQPSVFLMSGHLAPLSLPTPARLKGGTKTSMEVRPTSLRPASGAPELFDNVQSIVLHVSFNGVEVSK